LGFLEYVNHLFYSPPGELLEIYGRQLLRRAEYSAVGHVWDPKRYMDSQVGGAVSRVERNSITK